MQQGSEPRAGGGALDPRLLLAAVTPLTPRLQAQHPCRRPLRLQHEQPLV